MGHIEEEEENRFIIQMAYHHLLKFLVKTMDGKVVGWSVGWLVVVVGDDSPLLLFGFSLVRGPLCCRVTDGAPDWSHHTHTGSLSLLIRTQTFLFLFLLKRVSTRKFDKFTKQNFLLLTVTDVIGITLKKHFYFLFVVSPVDSFRNWPFFFFFY